MLDKARSYLNKTWIGTNSSDSGECVGFFNKVVLDVTGVLYPIKGANGAKDILTATNTRPDLFEQVKNDPRNPNQLPSPGDWVIWGATWGNGWGHVSNVETVSSVAFTGIEQNFVAHTVTRQQHNWSGVIGWVHFKQGDDMALTRDLIVQEYRVNRGADPSEAEIAGHLNGGTMASLSLGFKQENDATRAQNAKAIADLQLALKNEQNKPPKEVVKEVEKIVEKIVEKPVDEKAVVEGWFKKLWNKLFNYLEQII